MGRTITLPDDVYARLDAEARAQGLSIEQLLRAWPVSATAAQGAMPEVLAHIEALGDEFSAHYGEMPDSTALVREDRAR